MSLTAKQAMHVGKLLHRVSMEVLGVRFMPIASLDRKSFDRVYIQIQYEAPCTKTGIKENWKGRKWYLSEHMTDDEVIKTAYAALEATVKHEIMEGFKVDGKILFNPHVSFEALLSISDQEVSRDG
jgi:hypothetical protein